MDLDRACGGRRFPGFLRAGSSDLGWATWRYSARCRASGRACRSCLRNVWPRRSPRRRSIFWLGTRLHLSEAVCAGVILAGVAVALAPDRGWEGNRRVFLIGVLFGIGSALGQAFGAVISRKANLVATLAHFEIDGGTAAFQRIVGRVMLTLPCWWLLRQAKGASDLAGQGATAGLAFRGGQCVWPG